MYLYGAGGHAKVVADILLENNEQIEGVFDDNCEIKKLLKYDVKPYTDEVNFRNSKLIISIGDNATRKELSNILQAEYGLAVHKRSYLSKLSKIGPGSVVMPGATINAATEIGQHCIINTNASIDHDCYISDFVHISPNATLCGSVNVLEGANIGAGAIIIPGKIIGRWAVIGAGSVIIRDVPDNTIVVGNPGRIIR